MSIPLRCRGLPDAADVAAAEVGGYACDCCKECQDCAKLLPGPASKRIGDDENGGAQECPHGLPATPQRSISASGGACNFRFNIEPCRHPRKPNDADHDCFEPIGAGWHRCLLLLRRVILGGPGRQLPVAPATLPATFRVGEPPRRGSRLERSTGFFLP